MFSCTKGGYFTFCCVFEKDSGVVRFTAEGLFDEVGDTSHRPVGHAGGDNSVIWEDPVGFTVSIPHWIENEVCQ